MEDRVGQRLGNYRLIRLLGRGGFAEVYLGEHVHLKTQTAVKVLYTRLASTEEVEKFQKEAQTIAHLEHPNIVRVFDFDVVNGTPFLVMSYAPGGTLRQHHPKGSILPLSTIVAYIKQAADALQYAHDQRVVHRDVKPENMLVGQRDEVLLSDFGIATVAQSSHYQDTQEMVGTMAYMAPEQIQGKPRPASDQYALGIVVYEWLSGDRPFHGSLTELVGQHLAVQPPSLREKLPTVSVEVERVVMTALAKDYKQRFDSVQAFAQALEQASQSTQPRPLMVGIPNPGQPGEVPTEAAQLAAPVPSIDIPVQPDVVSLPSEMGQAPVTIMQPGQAERQMDTPDILSRSGSHQQRMPRRTVIAGLGLLGLVIAGGSVAWFAIPRGLSSSINHSTATPSGKITPRPSPTSIPPGTTLFIYRMHSGDVKAVEWSPDSKRIASGSADKTVQVWGVANGEHAFSYRGHSGSVQAVAWSPDGKRIASGSADNTVQVWDAVGGDSVAADGMHVFTYKGHTDIVNAVAWSPDGKRIASGSNDNVVQVWDAATGGQVYTYLGHSNSVQAVAWSPDGKRIASGSGDNTVQVWDAVGGDSVATTGGNVYTYRGHADGVNAVAWSPDGKRIASGGFDNTIQVWDAINGGNVYTYHGHSDSVEAVAWSPDGNRIASGSNDKTVQVWNAATGGSVFVYRGHSNTVWSVAWSPDGSNIVSGSADKTVQVWRAG